MTVRCTVLLIGVCGLLIVQGGEAGSRKSYRHGSPAKVLADSTIHVDANTSITLTGVDVVHQLHVTDFHF